MESEENRTNRKKAAEAKCTSKGKVIERRGFLLKIEMDSGVSHYRGSIHSH